MVKAGCGCDRRRRTAARRAGLLAAVCWFVSSPVPAATLSVAERLLAGDRLVCQPELAHFCHNLHIGCAGVSRVRTFRFALRLDAAASPVQLVEGKATAAPAGARDSRQVEELVRRFKGSRVVRGAGDQHLLLRPPTTNGYLKLWASGRYILRHYLRGRALMSLGACRQGNPTRLRPD